MDQNNYIFEVEDLCKYFPAGKKKVVKAVDGINLKIRKGETIGLVGESGCGKTTCGKTCTGILEKTDGEVFFQGQRERFFLKEKMYPNFMERNCYLSKRMFRSYSRIRMHLWTHV